MSISGDKKTQPKDENPLTESVQNKLAGIFPKTDQSTPQSPQATETFVTLDDKYSLLNLKEDSFSGDSSRKYLIANKLLGESVRNKVFKAWPLKWDEESKAYVLAKDEPVVLKLFPKQGAPETLKLDIDKEKKMLDQVFPEHKMHPMEDSTNFYLETKFIPGKPLLGPTGDLHPVIAKLSLVEKLKLIQDIYSEIAKLHARGVLHGDIKGQNILLEIKDGKIIPHVIDFGCANFKKEGETFGGGSPGRLTFTAALGRMSEENDVYALVPDILKILGVADPLKNKLEARARIRALDEKKIEDLIALYPPSIKTYLASFSVDARKEIVENIEDSQAKFEEKDLGKMFDTFNPPLSSSAKKELFALHDAFIAKLFAFKESDYPSAREAAEFFEREIERLERFCHYKARQSIFDLTSDVRLLQQLVPDKSKATPKK